MQSLVIQDWISLSSTTQWPAASGKYYLAQSEPRWVVSRAFQDAVFLVEVQFVSGTPSLQFETAPSADHSLFVAMQSGLALSGLAGSSAIVAALAHAVTGPPVAEYVRWAITSTGTWETCLRITMSAI